MFHFYTHRKRQEINFLCPFKVQWIDAVLPKFYYKERNIETLNRNIGSKTQYKLILKISRTMVMKGKKTATKLFIYRKEEPHRLYGM